jgi:hypothetical protein
VSTSRELVLAEIVFAMDCAADESCRIVRVLPVKASALPPRKKLPLPLANVRLFS